MSRDGGGAPYGAGRAPATAGASAPVGVVVNPVHPAGLRALARLLKAAPAAGVPDPLVAYTTVDAPGGPQARDLVAAGAARVVVIGGDGTVRHAAAGLTGAPVPLAVVPTGTANLLARNLGIRPGARARAAALSTALTSTRTRPLDLGLARLVVPGPDGAPAEVNDVFLVVAGIGHDAATVAGTDTARKHRGSWIAYFRSGAAHLLDAPLPMRVRLDGARPEDLRTWTVLCGNLGRIPGGIPVFPDARGDDGLLDVLTVPVASPRGWAGAALSGLTRHRLPSTSLRYRRAATVEVVPAVPAPVQLDGDVVPVVTRLTLTLRPGALRLVVPPGAVRAARPEPNPAPRRRPRRPAR